MSAAPVLIEADEQIIPRERLKPRSLGLRPLTRKELREKSRIDADPDLLAALAARPRTRGDCKNGPRPCPWVGCAMHLGIEVLGSGAAKIAFPDKDDGVDLGAMAETCAFDVADRGEHLMLEDIAALMSMTPSWVQKIERWGLIKVRVELAVRGSLRRSGRRGELRRPPPRPRRMSVQSAVRERRWVELRVRREARRVVLETNRDRMALWLSQRRQSRTLAGLRRFLGDAAAGISADLLRAFVRRELPHLAPDHGAGRG